MNIQKGYYWYRNIFGNMVVVWGPSGPGATKEGLPTFRFIGVEGDVGIYPDNLGPRIVEPSAQWFSAVLDTLFAVQDQSAYLDFDEKTRKKVMEAVRLGSVVTGIMTEYELGPQVTGRPVATLRSDLLNKLDAAVQGEHELEFLLQMLPSLRELWRVAHETGVEETRMEHASKL